jgi:uncharacterized protein
MPYPRYLTQEIRRLWAEEGKMAFVAGPRQVGKTTLARQLLEPAGAYFNWDVESSRRAILKDPENFWRAAVPSDGGKIPRVALDEIHKYPRWKRFLKGLYDAEAGQARFLVTGSGRLDIYQRGGDSLFGRYALYRLHPFTVGELLAPERATVPTPDDFWGEALGSETDPSGTREALERIETFTGFPEPLFAGRRERLMRWRLARRRLVILEDLRDLTRLREIGMVESLISLLPERIGAPLSVNNLAQTLGVAFNTAAGWLQALARLYFLFEIRPYAGRMARALRREGKVYLFDPTEVPDRGARFENVAALHLKKLCDAWTDWGYGEFELAYIRDKEGHEVDFLILRDGRPYALMEMKLSDPDVSPSLRYFRERLKPAHAVQVVRDLSGASVQKRGDGVSVVSAASFFAHM